MDDFEEDSRESRVVGFHNRDTRRAPYFGLNSEGVQNLVDFRIRDSSRTAFAYSNLRFLDYDSEDDIITIEFGPFVVSISGVGLNVIYEGLLEGRIRWLRESDDEDDDELVDGVRIDAIIRTPPQPQPTTYYVQRITSDEEGRA